MVSMTDPFNQCLHDVLERLKSSVKLLNHPANLGGLLAAHFDTSERFQREIGWQVYCDPAEWSQQNVVNLHQTPNLAILGCLLSEQAHKSNNVDSQAVATFKSNLARLQQRQAVFSFPNSWVLQSELVLGITLGIRAIVDLSLSVWMQTLLEEGIYRQDTPLFVRLAYSYATMIIRHPSHSRARPKISIEPAQCSIPELAFAVWLIKRQVLDCGEHDQSQWLENAHSTLVSRLLTEPPYEAEDYKAAIIWDVVTGYIATRSHYPTLNLVSTALQNFPAAMERWKSKWNIEDEYDIQSLLWLTLRTYFDDLHYEEYLPKLGRSGERYDIGIPQLGLIIEVKYIRRSSDFQKIVNEIGKDSAQLQPQSTFTGIVVFVYDASRAIEQHDWARRTLESIASVKLVIIVSAPSMC